MSPGATFERVYLALKDRIRHGYFRPGEHIDPGLLGEELASSVTPVRDALHRLVGEGLVEAPRSDGFRAPLLTEIALRRLYSWNMDLLLLVLRTPRLPPSHGPVTLPSFSDTAEPAKVAAATEALFLEIARASANPEHVRAIAGAGDRLHSLRIIEPEMLEDVAREAHELVRLFREAEIPALRQAIASYHKRRHRAAPDLVEALYRLPSAPRGETQGETI